MQRAYVVTGTLVNAQTLALDEMLPVTTNRVRIVVEPLIVEPPRALSAVLADIRHRQAARGHRPVLREEIDRYVVNERNSWES